jgi:hypothetical protein
MTDATEYLLYLQEQEALICRSCKHCLQPDGIEDHLRRKHLTIPLDVRKELVSYAKGLILRTPSEVVAPVTVDLAFDGLKVIQGFRCSICQSLYGTLRSIEKHCTTHRWMKPEGMSHDEMI